jgi:4-hydroxybenzoate polyprenyltransferase
MRTGHGGKETVAAAWLTWKMPVEPQALDFLRELEKKGIRTRVLVRPGQAAEAGAWLKARGIGAEVIERAGQMESTCRYVGRSPAAGARAGKWNRPSREKGGESFYTGFFRAIRVHHWVKNGLVFLPVLTSHTYGNPEVLLGAGWLFVAWSLVASAVYLTNDFFDLPADRRHPGRSQRPMASGDFCLRSGMLLAAGMAAAGLVIAGKISAACLLLLSLYALLSLAYTIAIKRFAFVDVAVLSALYLVRILGGGEATGNEVTPWLLAFSGFFFLGLAFLKRAGELREPRLLSFHAARTPSRGYRVTDLGRVERLGIASGLLSVLVLALYPISEAAELLYRHPELLWILAGLLLFWQGRLWVHTRRGMMHHDPIFYSVRDPGSWLIAGFGLAVMCAAVI